MTKEEKLAIEEFRAEKDYDKKMKLITKYLIKKHKKAWEELAKW